MSDAFLRVALARRLAAELVSDAWDRAIARVRHDWRASFRALRALKRLLMETPSADLWWRAPYWEGVRREIRAGDARHAPYVLARRHQFGATASPSTRHGRRCRLLRGAAREEAIVYYRTIVLLLVFVVY